MSPETFPDSFHRAALLAKAAMEGVGEVHEAMTDLLGAFCLLADPEIADRLAEVTADRIRAFPWDKLKASREAFYRSRQ